MQKTMTRQLFIFALFAVIPLFGEDKSQLITHVTPNDGNFQTHLRFENTNSGEANLLLRPYSAEGEALDSVSVGIGGFQNAEITTAELFGGINVSHVAVDFPAGVKVFAVYSSGFAPSTLVPASSELASTWRVLSGSWEDMFYASAVVNKGSQPTDVWVHLFDGQGAIVGARPLARNLAGDHKALNVLTQSTFAPLDLSEVTHLEISATQPLALVGFQGQTQIRGALWANPNIAVNTARSDRDELGVWFITEGDQDDVYELMGYHIAKDRLWQSEQLRRFSRGTLAEIFGPNLLPQDILIRTIGYFELELQQAFDALDANSRRVIQSYVRGMNRRIAEVHGDPSLLPFEFLALGRNRIDEWKPTDVLAWAVHLQRTFSGLFRATPQIDNLARLQDLIQRYGQEQGAAMWQDLHWQQDASAVTIIPATDNGKTRTSAPIPELLPGTPDVRDFAANLAEVHRQTEAFSKEMGLHFKGGSFGWVVSGDKTASGNPILYGAPQLEDPRFFSVPSLVIEGSVRGGGLNVSGMTVIGIPGFLVGRTPNHAWTLMSGHGNAIDYYFENPEDVAPHRVETFQVAGGDPVELTLFRSARGPIINQEPLISVRNANQGLEFNFVDVMLNWANAENMNEFGQGAELLGSPMHILYANREGDIAYWMGGREPVRPEGEWRLPQGATAPALEWEAGLQPIFHDANPEQGFYGGWNNKAHPDWFDYGAQSLFGRFWHSNIIDNYLRESDAFTFEDMSQMALKVGTSHTSEILTGSDFLVFAGDPWEMVAPYFADAVAGSPTPARGAALAMIQEWDRRLVAGGESAWVNGPDLADAFILADRWISRFVDLTFDELAGVPIFESVFNYHYLNAALHSLDPDPFVVNQYDWFQIDGSQEAGDRDALILQALDESLAELGEGPWGAGQRPLIAFNHPLFGNLSQQVPGLQVAYINRGTYTQTVELDENGPSRIESFFPIGPSGEVLAGADGGFIFNPNFFSIVPFFGSFSQRPFPLFQ